MVFSRKKGDKVDSADASKTSAVAAKNDETPKTEKKVKAEKVKKEKPKKEKAKKEGAVKAEKPSRAKGKRFVFIIGDEGCILVFMQGSKVARRLFAPSAQPSHTEAMLELIGQNSNAPIYVLADVLDQQYMPHTLPPVNSMSIPGLAKRRLTRDFSADDLKNFLVLGRDKTGRKEWKILLIALAKTPLIAEWLDLLINLPNELKGIYLSPIEAITYVESLNKALGNSSPTPWQLFISHNKVSGFRQVVSHEGKIVFTRVSQAIDDGVPAVIAGNIEQEIINTLEYMKRLEFRSENELDATIIVSQDVAESLDTKRFGFSHGNVLTPLRVAELLGLEQAALSADRYGDVVMAAAFGLAKKRRLRFATPYLDKLAKIYQARVAIQVVAALGVIAMLGLTLVTAVDVISDYSAASKFESDTTSLQSKLQNAKNKVGLLKQDVTFKSAVVTASDSYLKDAPTPEAFAKALMNYVTPQSRIVSIEWRYNDPSKKDGAGRKLVEAKVDVDFTGAGTSQELLTKAADKFSNAFKSGIEGYEVTVPAYPWIEQGTSESLSLNLAQVSNVPPEKRIVTYTLVPKPGAKL